MRDALPTNRPNVDIVAYRPVVNCQASHFAVAGAQLLKD